MTTRRPIPSPAPRDPAVHAPALWAPALWALALWALVLAAVPATPATMGPLPGLPGAPPALGAGPLADPLPDLGQAPFEVRLETVATGLIFPTHVAAPPDGSGRLFVTGVDGVVRVVVDGAVLPTPFLDLSASYHPTNGSAMAGLAFHPDFAVNRRLYVVHTEQDAPGLADFGVGSGVAQQSVLYEVRAQAGHPAPASNVADPASLRELMRINEDSTIHNLNGLAFGPDGYLYLGKGDDETGGLDLTTIHGSVLRIDVDRLPGNALSANGEYAIPADNPYATAGGGAVREVFAFGLRNPWRLTFDRGTGALWVTDIGEGHIEEVNRVSSGDGLGWPLMEGTFAHLPGVGVSDDLSGVPTTLFRDPVGQYDHGQGDTSITGGVLYRGRQYPELRGTYVGADWISGRLIQLLPQAGTMRHLPVDPAGATVNGWHSGEPLEGVISVAEDAEGELLLVVTRRDMSPTGRVLRLRPRGWWPSTGRGQALKKP